MTTDTTTLAAALRDRDLGHVWISTTQPNTVVVEVDTISGYSIRLDDDGTYHVRTTVTETGDEAPEWPIDQFDEVAAIVEHGDEPCGDCDRRVRWYESRSRWGHVDGSTCFLHPLAIPTDEQQETR